jgi:hypothetical protein
MFTRRSLFGGLALTLAGVSGTLGLLSRPDTVAARKHKRRRKKHYMGGGSGYR